MQFYSNAVVVGRVGMVKLFDKCMRVSVAVNYSVEGQSKVDWFDIVCFHNCDKYYDYLVSLMGLVVQFNCYLKPHVSVIGNVNVHSYSLILKSCESLSSIDIKNSSKGN